MKPNKYSILGAFLGLIFSAVAFVPIFGVVFGMSFFIGNAILFGLKLIDNGPIGIPFFYLGITAASICSIIFVIAGYKFGPKLERKGQ